MPTDSLHQQAARYVELLRAELANIPVEHWGYFFPASVALWRLIEEARPGVLGEVSAGYDQEPFFKGKGSEWFVADLLNAEEIIDVIDGLMRDMVGRIPRSLLRRGFVQLGDVPSVGLVDVERLVTSTLKRVDEAARAGRISP
jgi:hypothetical protein